MHVKYFALLMDSPAERLAPAFNTFHYIQYRSRVQRYMLCMMMIIINEGSLYIMHNDIKYIKIHRYDNAQCS